ncbi:MAG: hypothetical protein WC821_01185 [archaeon]|jgi:hypothetical protein
MSKKQLEEESYYSYKKEEDAEEPIFPFRKMITIGAIILVLIIVLALFFSLTNQKNNPLFGPNGEKISSKVSISKNGELIDSYETDGNILHLKGNPNDLVNSSIKTNMLVRQNQTIKLVVKNSNGQIVVKTVSDGTYLDENGNIHFTLNPLNDFGLEGYFDENTQTYIFPEGGSTDLTFQFVITDEDTNETTIIEIPSDYSFVEFVETGCISLERTNIKESTHYGSFELNTRIKVNCESYNDLVSSVNWTGEQMGNVEVTLGNNKYGGVLFSSERPIFPVPAQGEYDTKIVFTPFREYAGRTAMFVLNFGIGESKGKINFDLALDNLEQCVKITPTSMEIKPNQESTQMIIDVSSCSSKSVEISLCDNDPECSGNTEGGIELDRMSFSLSPQGNATKSVSITRKEISGAYGIPVYARIPGMLKVLIDEKVLIVQPTQAENIVPNKFVISLLGGTRDSIRIKNNTLTEDIPVEASVCSLYKSSLGIKGDTSIGAAMTSYVGLGKTWWNELATNYDYYSGTGKYQAAMINTLGATDSISMAAQQYSSQKNSQIKQAYTDSKGVLAKTKAVIDAAEKSNDSTKALQDAIGNANSFGAADMASSIVSIFSSITSLVSTATVLSTSLTAASTAEKAVLPCAVISEQKATMTAGMTDATSAGVLHYKTAGLILSTMGTLYSTYNSLVALSKDQETINAESALSNTKTSLDKLSKLEAKAIKANDYMQLMLASASVNSLTSASSDDEQAKEYLMSAKAELSSMQPILTEALDPLLTSSDDITVALTDNDNAKTDLIISALSSIVSLIGMLAPEAGTVGSIQAGLKATSGAIVTAMPLAQASCDLTPEAGDPTCCAAVGTLVTAQTAVTTAQSEATLQYANIISLIGQVNQLYSLFRTYQQMTTDYVPQLSDATTKITSAIDAIYALQDEITLANASITPAITAAGNLSKQEENSSEASTFEVSDSFVPLDGEYNKKRMIGIIGSAVSTGFVNGAYEGGVYTTKNTSYSTSSSPLRDSSDIDTSNSGSATSAPQIETTKKIFFADEETTTSQNDSLLKEDCANIVTMTMPDYIINLVHDGKEITISNNGVKAVWDFSDAQVFGVYESQEVGAVFASNGIRQNGYGLVEFNVMKHTHSNPTITNSTFGPFNVPDFAVEPTTIKYHFKFNAEPRKGNNYVAFVGNDCVNGLLRGTTGTSALPKTILSWDWNSVKGIGSLSSASTSYRSLTSAAVGSGSSEEPYLDATQMSILISKKIGALTNFLQTVSPYCPENPAKKVLTKVRINLINPDTGTEYTGGNDSEEICYLPMTTREYDGKPAIYYFFEDAAPTEWDYWFSDVEKINNAKEMTDIIDFNVNLMRDGYGTAFQYDFVNDYTGAILKAGPSFVDPVSGSKKYLEEKDYFYYSSQANFLNPNLKWTLPDAGKYRVKLVIDFADDTKLFESGIPNAKIIVDLYLLDPVNNGYSPWFYTPIDGSVGTKYAGSREKYGSSIMNSGDEFVVSNAAGAILESNQKDSLSRVGFTKVNNFALLNALPSMRGKIFDYTYNYNTKNYNDNNSKIIFSPTTATPLLFELNGIEGKETDFVYMINKDNNPFSSNLSNMFLLSSVGECSDFVDSPLSTFFKKTPDYGIGKLYGVGLSTAQVSGKSYLKTVAYSPVSENYSIVKPENGQIFSTNDLEGMSNPLPLGGINTMVSNDKSNSSTPNSLYNAFKGVEAKSICVSSLGNRELIWWPEDTIYAKAGNEGKKLSTKINDSSVSCVK